ncbi:MAG: cupredoxin domain-containing protein [Chloroflexi bacterium]|nr:cupredoxin domain-containing protein [Chloroflexota bacterium]
MYRRLMFLIVVGAILVAALAGCGGASSASAAGTGTAQNVSMTATEFKYDPSTINASPGQTIDLTLKNTGSVQHTWVLNPAHVKMTVDPGKSVSQTFQAPTTPGTYQFYCDEPGHKEAGMVGQLIVK